MPSNGQTALRSPNFTVYSESASSKLLEISLNRLEVLRATLQSIHGEQWVPKQKLTVWLPRNQSGWRAIASRSAEQGLFLSGPRGDWIIVNPEAPNFLEVLSHEYIHAVLSQLLPKLPTWFEEGICEYYSTLTLRASGKSTELILALPPGQRLRELRGVDTIRLSSLESGLTNQNSYALAWAAAYQLWPSFKPGQPFPATVPVGPFQPRISTLNFTPPRLTLSPLAPTAIEELVLEFHNQLPAAAPAPSAATAEAESIFLEALRLTDSGDHKSAIPLLEKACALRPSNSSWWLALAMAHLDASQPEPARLALRRALDTATSPMEESAARSLSLRLPRQ